MKADFKKSFHRDLRKIKDPGILERVAEVIEEVAKVAGSSELSALKKITGAKNFYRIRVGDYRIGVEIVKNEMVFA